MLATVARPLVAIEAWTVAVALYVLMMSGETPRCRGGA